MINIEQFFSPTVSLAEPRVHGKVTKLPIEFTSHNKINDEFFALPTLDCLT